MLERDAMTETAGQALEGSIRRGLPPGVELDEREEILLSAAAHQADAIEALEADIAERGFMVDGKLNPAAMEARQGRTALARLLGGIDLPGSKTLTQLRASKAAGVRWRSAS
jgi:hypothetical protein